MHYIKEHIIIIIIIIHRHPYLVEVCACTNKIDNFPSVRNWNLSSRDCVENMPLCILLSFFKGQTEGRKEGQTDTHTHTHTQIDHLLHLRTSSPSSGSKNIKYLVMCFPSQGSTWDLGDKGCLILAIFWHVCWPHPPHVGRTMQMRQTWKVKSYKENYISKSLFSVPKTWETRQNSII